MELVFSYLIVLRKCVFINVLLISILLFKWSYSYEQELTVTVASGQEECFFQTAQKGHFIEIDYQVIDGGHGNLDINFRLFNPLGRVLAMDIKKTENTHRQEAQESGDYKLCFDNSFSRISSKTVVFEVIVELETDEDEDYDDEGVTTQTKINTAAQEEYDATVEDIQDTVNNLKLRLSKVRHIQEQLRAFEARDRNIQERNFSMVNVWSATQLIVMIFVGVIQVVMLRSLFDDRSRIHKIWKVTR